MRRYICDLEETSVLATAAARAKSQFLASMSHEIRTPMNGVLGMLRLLARTHLSDHQEDLIKTALDAADHLLFILNDILDLAKAESGRLEFEYSAVDIEQLIHCVKNLYSPLAAERFINFDCCMADNMPAHLLTDPNRLKQILCNLVGNAIKFASGGEVELSASYSGNDHEGLLRFSVRDTGIGLSAEAQSKIFLPFEQASKSIAKDYGGTGLGLSICKQLTEGMNGEITVESTVDEGSTFCVEIPVKVHHAETERTPSESDRCPPENQDQPSQKTLKILAADDNSINRKLLNLLLGPSGHKLTTVENGKEVLLALDQEEFDLILMDIQMPVLDGVSATVKIRKSKKNYRDIPIIAITANAMKADCEKYFSAGMNAFVSKPIEPASLFSAIDAFADRAEFTAVPSENISRVNEKAVKKVVHEVDTDELLNILNDLDC